MSSELIVAFAADENYLDGLVGALGGLARRASARSIEAIILDCGISDDGWKAFEQCLCKEYPRLKMRRIPIEPALLERFNPEGVAMRLNASAFARLLLPDLLPELDRLLYLDCDVWVDADVTPLMDLPLGEAWAGVVKDRHIPRLATNIGEAFVQPGDEDQVAFNSGVMLLDLARLREEKLTERVLGLLKTVDGKFQDQALLNRLLVGRWKPLPECWNRQRFVTENFSLYRDYPDSLWHFIGQMKPWHFEPKHARGLMANFLGEITRCGWSLRRPGKWRPLSPIWRDGVKAARANGLRMARQIGLAGVSS